MGSNCSINVLPGTSVKNLIHHVVELTYASYKRPINICIAKGKRGQEIWGFCASFVLKEPASLESGLWERVSPRYRRKSAEAGEATASPGWHRQPSSPAPHLAFPSDIEM